MGQPQILIRQLEEGVLQIYRSYSSTTLEDLVSRVAQKMGSCAMVFG